jgi:hypothetical protein
MKQITPEDLRVLTDASADAARRAQALSRLSHWEKGKFDHLEPTIAALLELLQVRDEWSVARTDAAFALGQFVRFTGKERDRIIRALVKALQNDPDSAVQASCYEQLLQLLAPQREAPEIDDFDRARDVDWALLQPYV